MKAPHPLLRVLFAWLGYSSVHWAAGRYLRALMWDALLLACLLFVFYIPGWILLALIIGQIIDAAVIKPAQARSTGGYAIAMLIAICVGILVQVTLRTVWVEAFKIASSSTFPTLLQDDHVFIAKSARHPLRGDFIVFKSPKNSQLDFVKRVVAIGGDTVEIHDNQLVINGRPVPRVHIDAPCEYKERNEAGQWRTRQCDAWDETLDGRSYRVIFDRDGGTHSTPLVRVAPDSYFVLGDNRDNSYDSRIFGVVPQPHIKGIVRKVFWSSGPEGVRWERIDKRIR